MTTQLQDFLEQVVVAIELISAAILLIGFGKSIASFVKTEWQQARHTAGLDRLSGLRRQLGTYILLGLDFYIVSDIIHSMIQPELNQLLNLLLIVVLRTTIGHFLSKEIAEIEKREHFTTEGVNEKRVNSKGFHTDIKR